MKKMLDKKGAEGAYESGEKDSLSLRPSPPPAALQNSMNNQPQQENPGKQIPA